MENLKTSEEQQLKPTTTDSVDCCEPTCCGNEEEAKLSEEEQLKATVREKYGKIAEESADCCGTSCCGEDLDGFGPLVKNYDQLEGYAADADLGLGCGLPTEFAQIKKGDIVLDLGAGAGNDCFIARSETGETGKVIGVDMTQAMVDKARKNAEKLGYTNVEFILAEIEDMPLGDSLIDVAVSNCVLNLVPNKKKAFQEIFRVLKSGGHFSISDVVIQGKMPEGLQNDMEMYVGCVAKAIDKQDYLDLVQEIGFKDIQVQKESKIEIPKNILEKYNVKPEDDFGVYSITVFAKK